MNKITTSIFTALFVVGFFVMGIQSVSAATVELSGKELKAKTVAEVAALYTIDSNLFASALTEKIGVNVKTSDTFQLLGDNYGAETSDIKDIAAALQAEAGQAITAKDETTKTVADPETKFTTPEKEYNFLPIAIGLLLAYAISFALSRFKVITYMLHKKIWNWLLLAFFIVSCVLGSFLALRISNGLIIPLPFNMLYWHVEAGIAMTMISFFHIIWHWRYFVALVKKRI